MRNVPPALTNRVQECVWVLLQELRKYTWVTVDGVSVSVAMSNKKEHYESEKELLQDINSRGVGTIRIHTKDFSRILDASAETYTLGIVSCPRKQSTIRKATVTLLWGLLELDVTHKLNRYAGPDNDFYTQIGGYMRAKDIVRFPSFGHHRFLQIEWADGIIRHFLPDDITNAPGKLYPRVR
ncbi:hypothetical protein PSENEW3_00000299 [Picochlorum sp. SENEW3]|nr:hypothetical protein PSENEW3_00000299 [Picochlorum sp. SENEW3]